MHTLTLLSDEGPIRSGRHHNTLHFGGTLDQRYTIKVLNESGRRVEAVVTVDGRSVIDGEPGSYASRGMIVPAYGSVVFDGWRTSLDGISAFRIASPGESYAAAKGAPSNVGIIGLAIFEERRREVYRGGASSRGMPGPRPKNASASVTRGGASKGSVGTAFGEHHTSHVSTTTFDRASSTPVYVQTFRYDTIAELIAQGILAADDGLRAFPGNPDTPGFCKPA